MRSCKMSSSSLSNPGISVSSRNDPLKFELRMLLPEVELIERLELGRIIISTSPVSSTIDGSKTDVVTPDVKYLEL